MAPCVASLSQSASKFVFVNVLVLRDVLEGAVWPCAARCPPEEALLLLQTAEKKTNVNLS